MVGNKTTANRRFSYIYVPLSLVISDSPVCNTPDTRPYPSSLLSPACLQVQPGCVH